MLRVRLRDAHGYQGRSNLKIVGRFVCRLGWPTRTVALLLLAGRQNLIAEHLRYLSSNLSDWKNLSSDVTTLKHHCHCFLSLLPSDDSFPGVSPFASQLPSDPSPAFDHMRPAAFASHQLLSQLNPSP